MKSKLAHIAKAEFYNAINQKKKALIHFEKAKEYQIAGDLANELGYNLRSKINYELAKKPGIRQETVKTVPTKLLQAYELAYLNPENQKRNNSIKIKEVYKAMPKENFFFTQPKTFFN